MSVRITQVPVETSIHPTDGQVRITQVPVETSIHPTDGQARVTQVVVETSIAVVPPGPDSWQQQPQMPQFLFYKKGYAALRQQASTLVIVQVARRQPNVFVVC